MRLLFDLNHPAHVHMLRPVIAAMAERGHEYLIAARAKDVTLPLLEHYGLPYKVLTPVRRGLLGQALELCVREWKFYRLARGFAPQAIIGTSAHAARVGRVLGAKSIVLNSDNAAEVRFYCWLAYPGATAVITPAALAHERHGRRHITYPANHQLFYLHPVRFTPDPLVRAEMGLAADEPFAIVRLSALTAHHDRGIRGIDAAFLRRLKTEVEGKLRLLITSERALPDDLAADRLALPAHRIHHALAAAEFYLGDSQSMTTEAAMLGTPAFRMSSFVGRLSVIAEVEQAGLAFGFRPGQEERLLHEILDLLAQPNRRALCSSRRAAFLRDHIDPLPWFVDQVERIVTNRR
jgi:hypothetical protein